MQHFFYFLLLLWLPHLPVRAQTLAGTYTQLLPYSGQQASALSADAHPAALAEVKHFSMAFYGERRFLIRELGWYQCAAAWPVSGGGFALSSSYNGGGPQQQTRFSLLYARTWGRLQAGLHFDYHLDAIQGYGHRSFAGAGAGLLVPLGRSLRTGLQFTRAATTRSSASLPASFSAGLGYDLSPQFFIGGVVAKEENKITQVQVGLQYMPLPQLALHAGFDAATALYYFGVLLALSDVCIDLSAALHPQLGPTPGLAILYPSTSIR